MTKRQTDKADKAIAKKATTPALTMPKKFPRRPRTLAKQVPTVDLSALDLSPFRARGDAAGLSVTQSRFLALYMEDRLAGRTTARCKLYRALTGCSEVSSLSGSWQVWRAIVSHGLIAEILAGAGITEDSAFEALKESLTGKQITRRRNDEGLIDYETTELPAAKAAAAKTVLELLGVYVERLEVELKAKTFAELVREAAIEARETEEADFTETNDRTTENE